MIDYYREWPKKLEHVDIEVHKAVDHEDLSDSIDPVTDFRCEVPIKLENVALALGSRVSSATGSGALPQHILIS